MSITYQELGSLTYGELAQKTYALESGGQSSGGYCIWTEERIAAIESQLDAILEKLSVLEGKLSEGQIADAVWTSSERTLTQRIATPEDVKLTTTTQTVQVTTQEVDLSELKTYGDTNWKTASGFATPSNVTAAQNTILAQCKTATGFAKPSDVKLTTTTEKVEVISQTVDLSGMATLANQQAILTDLATIRTTTNDISKDVSSVYSYVTEISEIPEAVWTYGADFNARTVKANGVSLDGTDLSVQVDSAEIANAVWSRTVRTLTSGDNIDFPEFDTSVLDTLATSAEIQAIADGRKLTDLAVPTDLVVNTTTEKVEVVSQTVDLTGIAKTDDIETAKNAVISACKTAVGFSTTQDVKDAQEAILAQSGRIDVEEVAQAVWEYGGTPEERTVKSTGIEIGDVSVGVDTDKIAEAVWTAENRTLTGYTPIAPDDISGSSYCTRDDVERRWGVMNVRIWANIDNDDDELKIRAQIDWAILSATSRIESDFASYIYKLPFNPVPLEVRRHAAALAGVELFHCRAMAATNDSPTIQRAENEYFEWKTKIFSGIEIVGAERKE